MNYANSVGVIKGQEITVNNATGSTIVAYKRVSLTTATPASNVPNIALSAIGDVGIGYTTQDIPTGYNGVVRLSNASGTQIGLVASGITIAMNDPVWTATAGTLSNVQNTSGVLIGHFLAAAATGTPVNFIICPAATS